MKRGGYIQRHTPMERGAPVKRRRARRIDRETPAERLHKELVREMGCCAAGLGPCDGPLQAAHLGHTRGTGLPHGTQEDTAMMCRGHHDQFDGRADGPLRELGAGKWDLARVWIAAARAFVARQRREDAAPLTVEEVNGGPIRADSKFFPGQAVMLASVPPRAPCLRACGGCDGAPDCACDCHRRAA